MKTVPSLVASSTIGVAAAGLALGRPERTTPSRPTSKKRKSRDLADAEDRGQDLPSTRSRPGTSSTAITLENRLFHQAQDFSPGPLPPVRHQRPMNTRVEDHISGGGRRIVRHGELASPLEHAGDDPRRDSGSSKGSWMRRLSTIPPLSQNNSPRSSVGPDSPSLSASHGSVALSHNSAAPILSSPGSSPAQLPPNKLVKRATSGRAANDSRSRANSRTHVPTLRRPATSHQRSFTLQQQFQEHSAQPASQFETPPKTAPSPHIESPTPTLTWRPFFTSRPTKFTKERASARSSDGGLHNFLTTSRRILPEEDVRPCLMQPGMISTSGVSNMAYYYEDDSVPLDDETEEDPSATRELSATGSSTSDSRKHARRSLSMHFSSPTSWVSRSGSLRGKKRGFDRADSGKRYSSAPVSTLPGRKITTSNGAVGGHRAITDPAVFRSQTRESNPANNSFTALSFQQQRSRNSSLPLPPLSRLSSFNMDLVQLGLSSSSSSATHSSPTPPMPRNYPMGVGHHTPTSPLYFGSHKPPRTSEITDRASTLIGSDTDFKGFTSTDEEEVDFESETVFDSLRSAATTTTRSHDTQLDAMFNESPPSSVAKGRRLSIHELVTNGSLGGGNEQIIEEEEDMSTPVKDGRSRSVEETNLQTPVRKQSSGSDNLLASSPPNFSLPSKDLGCLSLDDEEDEDWTRDDEASDLGQLYPPSSSLNSRRVSSSVRAALADVTFGGSNSHPTRDERPKSNLFDWSEPPEKTNSNSRPKTAHVKQAADGRGGRALGRKGPSPLHIRSQSVPVVPDVAGQRDHSMGPKFGTWGLGAKGISEEWDNDFDFENDDAKDVDEGSSSLNHSGMLVPLAIQASQDNVVGHVGQIREVCLLVEDLKRLRLLAREKDLLTGESAHLWKEAEGIIALAVPEEEDLTLSPTQSPTLEPLGSENIEDRYVDYGSEAEALEQTEAPFEVLNRHGRPTEFMYDGNTVRRRSAFLPEDDVFGGVLHSPPTRDHLRPPTTVVRHSSLKSSSEYARSVMETMHQQRSTSDSLLGELTVQAANKMPFDTTSLRDLVNRASALSRALAEVIRKADGLQSPTISPHRDSSPAFTRVFTDPLASPPKNLPRTHSNNSILSGSIETSPTQSLGQRMHMMTVV